MNADNPVLTITHKDLAALARQFFPHFTERCGIACVKDLLRLHFEKPRPHLRPSASICG